MSPKYIPRREQSGHGVRERINACRKRLRVVRVMRRGKRSGAGGVGLAASQEVVLETREGLRSRLATNILIDMEAGVCWLEARFAREVDRGRFRVQD